MPKNPAPLLCLGWLAACAAAVALGLAVRLGPAELPWAWPAPGGADAAASVSLPAALVLTCAAALLLVAGAGRARAAGLQKPWAQLLLLHPVLLAFIWLIWPVGRMDPRSWLLGGVLAAGACVALRPLRLIQALRARESPRLRMRDFQADAAMAAASLLLGLTAGTHFDWPALAWSCLLYPLFALAQLLVFLVFPADRLAAIGLRPVGIRLACTLAFALAHWPNPLAVAVTAVAMFVWAGQRLRGRSLPSLAVGMGVVAALFTQSVPDSWSAHMRIGPGYARQQAADALSALPGAAGDAQGTPTARGPSLPQYLRDLYPRTVGRPPAEADLRAWQEAFALARRRTVVWEFIASSEYARVLTWGPCPDPQLRKGPEFSRWRGIVEDLTADAYWQAEGGTWEGYLAGLYRDVLQRRGSPAEIATWDDSLSLVQRRRIALLLLERGPGWRSAPPAALDFRELIAPPLAVLGAARPDQNTRRDR